MLVGQKKFLREADKFRDPKVWWIKKGYWYKQCLWNKEKDLKK